MTTSKDTTRKATNVDLLVSDTPEQAAFFHVVRAASRLEAELNRLLRPFDLTTATLTILSILDRAGGDGLSCGDIAAQLIAEVPDMTRLLDRLERLEYVFRERSQVDRRMVRVKITPKGREVVANLKSQTQECHRRQFSRLSPESLKTLEGLLRDIGRPEGMTSGATEAREPEAKRGVGGM
jgi:DNA-binding MarR family transcriptional regulator